MSKKRSVYIFFVALVLLFNSCKAKRAQQNDEKLKHKSSKELVACLEASKFKGDWLSTKASIDILFKGEKNGLRSNLRMKVDSAAWISLSKATVPVITALVSQDSVKFLNKLNKQYYLNNFESINQLLNTEIDYELLQDFFLGNPVAFDYEEDYVVKVEDDAYLISSERSKKIEKLIRKGKIKDEPILYRCWIEPEHCKCQKVMINLLTQDTELEVNYGSWEDINGQYFPMVSSMKLSTPTDTLLLEMNYNKAVINEPETLPFNIPSSYTPFEFTNGED